jgi:spermidine/putrescine ABC transporter ATP-binding subunit
MAEPALELRGLEKRFGELRAVAGIDLAVAPGEFVTLLGPSGCGKTTTLNLIAGFAEPSAGAIVLGGRAIDRLPPFRRNLGVVFQDYALFPHMSVAQNVAFGLRMRGHQRSDVARQVQEALALVKLEGLEQRRPQQLSGGQRQRVALARALVIKPQMLLLDEPLSNLDLKLREEMRLEITRLQRRLGIATVFVTHDQGEALAMSDRIAVMNAGRIEQIGTPGEIYERPRSRFVAEFIGSINIVPAVVEAPANGAGIVTLATPIGTLFAVSDLPLAIGAAVDVAFRPERVALHERAAACDRAQALVPARVAEAVYLGARSEIRLEAGGRSILVETPNLREHARLQPGAMVHAAIAAEDCRVLVGPTP